MATGDIYRVTAGFADADTGKNYATSFHFRQDFPVGDAAIGAVGLGVADWWTTDLGSGTAERTRHNSSLSLIRVQMRKVDPLSPVIEEYTTDLPAAGTASGDNAVPYSCLLLTLRTAISGRSFRGRMYIPTPTETLVVSGGAVSATVAENCADQMAGLFSDLDTAQLVPVVYSKLLSIATDITQVKCDRRTRSQRRRNVKQAIYVAGA